MTELHLDDQTIRHDRDATARIYQALDHGFVEKCGCVFCRNFAIQRDVIFPASFRALLEELGIDPNKEGEAFEYGPIEPGLHLYGGWFYLVGEMVASGEQNSIAAESPEFEFFFTTAGPPSPAFRDKPRLSIEFTARVKWVLEENPDAGRRRAKPPSESSRS